MGLLDEAIRDHLDLKRRRGADPTEIAREEREALEPVFPGEAQPAQPEDLLGTPAAAAQPEDLLEMPEAAAQPVSGSLAPEVAAAPAVPGAAAEPEHPDGALSTLGQETAELDMRAHMAGDAPADAASGEEDLLEWEEPSAASVETPSEQIPGQERLSLE
jgi:hypothetical protein